jgi:hypothetical protein
MDSFASKNVVLYQSKGVIFELVDTEELASEQKTYKSFGGAAGAEEALGNQQG